MLKGTAGILTALLVTGSSLVYAQTPSSTAGMQDRPRLSQSDLKALTDARVAVVKAALQLTPEQEKYWPALEEAIRARSTTRQQRLAALAEKLRGQPANVDPAELLRERADNLIQRGTELKKLVDAWQPLWQTLNTDQKERMRILARGVLRLVWNAVEERRMGMEEEDGDKD
jgi:hypothetical protein